MATLNETPSANRLHIGIYGKTNSGKSSLINALTNQEVSIVADVAGTTTDPVYKPMEIHPLGACVLIDTAGFDDTSELGTRRVEKTKLAAEKTDIAVIVLSAEEAVTCADEQGQIQDELKWYRFFREKHTPVLFVINKADQDEENAARLAEMIYEEAKEDAVIISAKKHTGIEEFKTTLIRLMPENFGAEYITGNLVEEARKRHDTSPVATAALGRLLTAGAMMGGMMKNETDVLTLQIKGDGPLGGITVTADAKGDVKGYVDHPEAMMPPKNGKLDVGGAVGIGLLNVIKDMGLKEPYVGQTILQTSEIAEDLTYYFATSEQVPSSVGLGVLMNKDNTVHCAGGFIVQVMPFISDEVLDKLEENIKKISSVTSMLDNGHTPEQMLEQVLDGLNVEFTDTMDTQFKCNCSHERIEKAIISIGKKDIQEMIDDGKEVEVKCHFCNMAYTFSVEELKQILKQAKR